MTKTEENLKLAFANESQANLKYRAFANKAQQDGFPNIARLFRLSSRVERIHAQSKLNAINGIGSTLENIKSAIARETNEKRTMYPLMLQQAVSDNHKAKHRFKNDIKSKEAHAQLYFSALVALKDGKDLTDGDLYLCPFCGNILSDKPEKNCSICRAPAARFIRV
ncbi:MAG: rubrerythrin family protein [Ignavibacteriaceae bacterium]